MAPSHPMNEGAGTPRFASTAENAATSASLPKPELRKIHPSASRPMSAMASFARTARRSIGSALGASVSWLMGSSSGFVRNVSDRPHWYLRCILEHDAEKGDTVFGKHNATPIFYRES